MENDLDFLLTGNEANIFTDTASFADFAQKIRPTRPAIVEFTDAGVNCQVKHYDSVYNAKGAKVLLRGGSKTKFHLERDRPTEAYESALVRTQHWTKDGEEDQVELEVRSPHMKAALKAVVPEYKDSSVNTSHITLFNEPRCLFYYRDELFSYGLGLDPSSDAQKHVSFLIEYMYKELGGAINTWTLMVDCELSGFSVDGPSLDFGNLWMAFRPRDYIFLKENDREALTMIVELTEISRSCHCTFALCVRRHRWDIRGRCIDRDKTEWGYSNVYRTIAYFEGFKTLRDLNVVPLRFLPDAAGIRSSHASRGRKFTSLQSQQHYRAYQGIAHVLGNDRNYTLMGEDDSFPLQETWINGRVVLDTRTFCDARPSHRIRLNMWENPKFKKAAAESADEFTDDEFMICHYRVAGFALKERRWGFFSVDKISDVPFDHATFNNALVLPQRTKNMISSLVRVHGTDRATFDDVITGKGKGMIFLLHGEPGVGKTLTAESVADHSRKPLLRIDASMLGITAKSVETNLAAAFRLAEKWNSVVLLDEADVFLEKRTSSDLRRNSLVSVFLRELEYYEGIMFLTTNRLDSFDPAFRSRIHLAIHYPKLDNKGRESIWRIFLEKISQDCLNECSSSGALRRFASVDLNGRQIKNVVKMAQAHAASDDADISSNHIHEALEVMKCFDDVTGLDGTSRARQKKGPSRKRNDLSESSDEEAEAEGQNDNGDDDDEEVDEEDGEDEEWDEEEEDEDGYKFEEIGGDDNSEDSRRKRPRLE